MRFFFCFIQLVIPEYLLHIVFNVFFLLAGEFTSFFLNAPLIAYHIHRWVHAKFDATIWCRRWSMDAVGLLINHVIRVYWLGTKIDRLWAARDCMIQQPSWMQVCVMSCDVYLYIRVESNVSFSRYFFSFVSLHRHPGQMSTRRLDQIGSLSALILLLSLRVSGLDRLAYTGNTICFWTIMQCISFDCVDYLTYIIIFRFSQNDFIVDIDISEEPCDNLSATRVHLEKSKSSNQNWFGKTLRSGHFSWHFNSLRA